jgi:hypothetical protein
VAGGDSGRTGGRTRYPRVVEEAALNAPARTAPVPLARRLRDAAVALVAVLAVLGVGLLVFGRRRDPPARPQPGDTLLAMDLPLDGGGASRRFRMRHPGRVEIDVEPGDGGDDAEVWVAFGPPQPPTPDGRDLPRDARTWTAKRGEEARRYPLFATGLYVLRVESRGPTPVASAKVRVRALPAETE